MTSRELVMERIQREREFIARQEVGTEEYNASMKRLDVLNDKLTELEKNEADAVVKEQQLVVDKKDRFTKIVVDIGKFVVGGVVIPLVGLVAITATEKDASFTGTLRDYTKLFIPKKM